MCQKPSRMPLTWKQFAKTENKMNKSHSKQSRIVQAPRQRRMSYDKTLTQEQFHPNMSNQHQMVSGPNAIWNAVNTVDICYQMSLNVLTKDTQMQNVADDWWVQMSI